MMEQNFPLADDHGDIESSASVTSEAEEETGSRAHSAGNNDKDEERNTLASKENAAVHWLRIVVFLVLVTTTATVTLMVHNNLKNSQIRDFENSFDAHATKVIDSFHIAVERKISAVDSLAASYTSFVSLTNASWPFVTLPDFEIKAGSARILGDTDVITFFPLVTDDKRQEWEKYQYENRGHYRKSCESEVYQRTLQDTKFNRPPESNCALPEEWSQKISVINLETVTISPAPPNSGPYLPVWQISPAPNLTGVMNMDGRSNPYIDITCSEVLRSEKAVIGITANLDGENQGGAGAYMRQQLSLSQYRYDASKLVVDPVSLFGHPIFDSFIQENRKVVGVLSMNIIWRLILINVLPENAVGVICVLENSFGDLITYRIDGTQASYVGNGDLHDTKYDHLEHRGNIAEYLESRTSPVTQSFTWVGLNTDFNTYSIRVYPSDDQKARIMNSDPLHFSLVVAAVFLFTSLVFLTYDYLVARRQKVVMDRAVASSAIVRSLFPSNVRTQIYKENELDDGSRRVQPYWSSSNKKQNIESYLAGRLQTDDMPTSISKNTPIAEEFQVTTVLFADIAGFTAWSSTRTPVQVFQLLETIYQAFDQVAMRRKVFKVETIGDCYVAVTGVPEAQEDHALIMAKFARDCMQKMRLLVSGLVDDLGEDTADLDMRFGMHSGSVTGGVLRGAKSRFQLFGDTMNTAARMESNGVRGRIHASQHTADALIAKGKGHWLTPREEKIVAKGKGEMQTYWILISEKTQESGPAQASGDLDYIEQAYIGRLKQGVEASKRVESLH